MWIHPTKDRAISIREAARLQTFPDSFVFCGSKDKQYQQVGNKLFIRKNSDVNYTEPHHLVPLSAYTDFPNINLDREQNVVSLCSNCHNQLHYGKDIEEMLFDLYIKRKDLLITVGIDVSFEQLKDYYK